LQAIPIIAHQLGRKQRRQARRDGVIVSKAAFCGLTASPRSRYLRLNWIDGTHEQPHSLSSRYTSADRQRW
jgi:hypothetical protein